MTQKKDMEDYINTTVGQRAIQKEYPFIIFDKKANQLCRQYQVL